jgi:hypothetical protein
VLQWALARTDGGGGGGLWWPEVIIEVARMHVWAPCQAVVRTVMLHHQICMSLFQKTIVVTGLVDISKLIATMAQQ